jgi:hypothetical protein
MSLSRELEALGVPREYQVAEYPAVPWLWALLASLETGNFDVARRVDQRLRAHGVIVRLRERESISPRAPRHRTVGFRR